MKSFTRGKLFTSSGWYHLETGYSPLMSHSQVKNTHTAFVEDMSGLTPEDNVATGTRKATENCNCNQISQWGSTSGILSWKIGNPAAHEIVGIEALACPEEDGGEPI